MRDARGLLVAALLCVAPFGRTRATVIASDAAVPPLDVTFPLGEHYRIGRYVPASVKGPPGSPVAVEVAGAIPVKLPGGTGTVPLLAVGTLTAAAPHLIRLEPEQRLIGVATDASDAGELLNDLFPAKSIVRVPLDRIQPLPGPALACGTLDAVLFDAATAARVTAQQLETLRAAGVAVAIRVEGRPSGNWPWQRRGAWWVLPPDELAAVQVVQPDRYAPAGEFAGATARFRQVIVASLACFAIAAIAASLWRSRRAWLVVIAVSIVAAAGMTFWNATQPKSATILKEETSGAWLDRYSQHVARADGDIRHPIPESAAASWPILFSPNHARDVDLALECRTDGTPLAFVAKLKRGQSIVFLDRSQTKRGRPEYPSTRPAK